MPDSGTTFVKLSSTGQWEDLNGNVYPASSVRVSSTDSTIGMITNSSPTSISSGTTPTYPERISATPGTRGKAISNTNFVAKLGKQIGSGETPTTGWGTDYYQKTGLPTGGKILGEDGKYYLAVWDGQGNIVPGEETTPPIVPEPPITLGQQSLVNQSDEPIYRITPEGLIMTQSPSGWQYSGQLNRSSGGTNTQEEIQAYNATTGAQQTADRAVQKQQLAQQKAESDMAAKIELAKLQAEPVDWIKAWYANQAMKGNKQNQTYSTPGEMVEATGVPKTAAWAGKTLADYLDANPVTYKELAPLNIVDPSRQETIDQAKELIRVNSAVNDNLNSVIGTTLGNANANLNTDVNNLTGGETGTWAEYLNANSPGQQSRTPQAPKTPDWLKQYAPGIGNKYGEITKVESPTLSGQQFSAIDPTKLQGLQGYLNWASTFKRPDGTLGGQSYEDMLSSIQRMQTKTPIGAGTQSWAATRQRSV
jgi:hypothetical protein